MPVSAAAILGELQQIEQRSPEDVAVLMTPLLRALEAIRDGRDPQLDHAQVMAIANSLAQTAAQAGDVDAAVAIAAVSAELEQLPLETFSAQSPPADRPDTRSGPTTAPASGTTPIAQRTPPLPPFANPYQQLLGILGICALSYAGYLEIQTQFQPGSVASWLLTGSSSLFALGVALSWRRFVLRRRTGPGLTALALVFALTAGGWAAQTRLTLHPQLTAGGVTDAAPMADAGTRARTAAQQPAGAAAGGSADAPQTAGAAASDAAPIAFWWLGVTPDGPPTRVPEQTARRAEAQIAAAPDRRATPARAQHAADTAADDAGAATDRVPAMPASAAGTSAVPSRQAAAAPAMSPPRPGSDVAARPPHRPESPLGRYRDLLDREVVITDVNGGRHAGKLTGISKHGVTLQMKVDLFGQPILAQRFYLFDNIEKLRAK